MQHRILAIPFIVALWSGVLSGCTAGSSTTPSPVRGSPTSAFAQLASATPTSPSTPLIALEEGDFYFSVDGRPGFLFSRNLAGYDPSQFDRLLGWTSAGGSRFVRLHLDAFGMGYSNAGEVDEAWARQWDAVFESAAARGVYVMPVFGVWYDWNDGDGYSTWMSNPLNEVNGGPAQISRELFEPDAVTQRLWLDWMATLVHRWERRENILAWEVFSE